VLLDVGGVFHLPLRLRISAALVRGGAQAPDAVTIDRAHFVAIGVFTLEPHPEPAPIWDDYLAAYAGSLGVADADLPKVLEHLTPEFATAAVWAEIVEGSRAGLEELVATGAAVGVVSNADGSVPERLRSQEILQTGRGPGVEVGCVVDSGRVGVAKPDPRIFQIALDTLDVAPEDAWYVGDTPGVDVVGARRAGIRPVLMDPFRLRRHLGVDAVGSLHEVAAMVMSS
jgi:putative hydrolase of the HAD superfamily